MKKKVITAIGILLITAGAIVSKIWTPYGFDAFVLIMSILGAWEVAQALIKMDRPTNVYLSIAYSIIVYAGVCAGYILKWKWSYFLYYYLIALLGLAIIVFVVALITKRKEEDTVKEAWDMTINTAFTWIYPTVFISMLYFINHFSDSVSVSGSSVISESSFYMFIILLVFTITMITDTMAMFTGMTIKGPKLCPKISPNKTISGAIGGLVFGSLGAVALYLIFSTSPAFVSASELLNLNIVWVAIIGIVGSLFTQIGDIFASYIKRKAEIKDYSNIIPGHGGVMDRVDGLIFNAVWIAAVLAFICRVL